MISLRALGRSAHRHRRAFLAATLVLLGLAAVYGRGAHHNLKAGGFQDPNSESGRAAAVLKSTFAVGEPDVVVAYAHPQWHVTDAQFRAALQPVLESLAANPAVLHVSTPYGAVADALVSKNGRTVVVTIELVDAESSIASIVPRLEAGALTTTIGGSIPAIHETEDRARSDLVRGELLVLPLIGLLLVVFFRGVVVALVPVMIGGFAIAGALACLRLLSQLTTVSIFAMNIVTLLGLGLAVDYSVFVVARFREELARQHDVQLALEITLDTVGRTVAYSGLAVACSLLSLLVLPTNLFRSIALSGAIVVIMAVTAVLVALPAALSLLGERLLRGQGTWRADAAPGKTWGRIARWVFRAPIATAAITSLALLMLAAPFVRINYAAGGPEVLPAGTGPREVANLMESGQFEPGVETPILLAVSTDAPVTSQEGLASLTAFTNQIAALPDVARVDSIVSSSHTTMDPRQARSMLQRMVKGNVTTIRVTSPRQPGSREASTLVTNIRDISVPGVSALVGGEAAQLLDLKSGIAARLPWVLGIIFGSTVAILFLAFGSLVIPLKAVLMSSLSLTASFGALVWVFQDGRFERLLRYDSSGDIQIAIPVVMFAVVFGLAMDYELLLLSRIREAYLETRDSHGSIVSGMEQTGRLITRAAALLVVVMVGFMTAHMLLIKQLGVAVAVAIIIDVTIVRALLVPATMHLLGRHNWWSPRWLARLWQRWGLGIDEGLDRSRH